MVDDALSKGIRPDRIVFLAFTRKAANEARERAIARFALSEQDFPFFRTLHSFAYRMLCVQKQDLMTKEHYDELSKAIGFDLNIASVNDIEEGPSINVDHPILSIINLSRLKKVSLRTEYNLSDVDHTWQEVSFIDRSYTEYKKLNGLLDYTDMLSQFAEQGPTLCPQFDICFLDEAQDLSPLQWEIAHVLNDKTRHMWVAGDDDQAIYRFAGADSEYFQSLDTGAEVLEQSYRIPSSVHTVAERIASRISNRFPKTYKPRKEVGSVSRLHSIYDVDMSEGSWLIMAQANYMLTPLAQDLRSGGYLFERNGVRSISAKMSSAINGWEQLRKGKKLDLDTVKDIYYYMSGNGGRVARGKKKIQAEDDKTFDLSELQEEHGLLADESMIWHEALDKLPSADRAYITALLRRGEKFNAIPRIRLSTIHQTKGGEADNVVVFQDLTVAALKGNEDDLHRVFYVAVTRTKENLFLIEPEDFTRAYQI